MAVSKNLWGGRFTSRPDETFFRFNQSFDFDRRLFWADIRASIAHCDGLFEAGVLSRLEADKIRNALQTLQKRADFDTGYFDESKAEDIHSFIEEKVVQLIGDTGRKLNTGRSRNDQVATAFRLWLREELEGIDREIVSFLHALLGLAKKYESSILPGYTHLQRAQPILWPHWCLAYYEMLMRDRERLGEAWRRANSLPLGAGALAGTSFEIDREAIARKLGFEAVCRNSLDAVSDRDFALEFIGAASLLMMHLSRFAEDLILYASSEFGFIELSDAVSTGSSMLPQKKNPDALELIRGKAGRVFGHQMALLATMKGLPMAYNKDMQEDKEAVFDTADTLMGCIQVSAIIAKNIRLRDGRGEAAAESGYLNAAELADYLVRKGEAFRNAHEMAGKIVLFAIARERELSELSLEEMRRFSPMIENDVFEALEIEAALASKGQIGGTSRERVGMEIENAALRLQN